MLLCAAALSVPNPLQQLHTKFHAAHLVVQLSLPGSALPSDSLGVCVKGFNTKSYIGKNLFLKTPLYHCLSTFPYFEHTTQSTQTCMCTRCLWLVFQGYILEFSGKASTAMEFITRYVINTKYTSLLRMLNCIQGSSGFFYIKKSCGLHVCMYVYICMCIMCMLGAHEG